MESSPRQRRSPPLLAYAASLVVLWIVTRRSSRGKASRHEMNTTLTDPDLTAEDTAEETTGGTSGGAVYISCVPWQLFGHSNTVQYSESPTRERSKIAATGF